MKAALVAAALVSALALVAAGCGGDDEESSGTSEAVTWADGFCTAVSTWTDTLEELGNRFSDLSNLNQGSIESGANDLREATAALTDDLRSLGRPDTEAGDEVEQAVDDLVTTVDDDLAGIQETVEGISGLQDLPGAISSLTSTFTSMSQTLSSAVTTIEDADAGDELRDAFEQAPACDELSGSSD